MSKPLTLLVAMVYGMAWVVGPVNVLAAVLATREGGDSVGYASTILLSFAVILIIHSKMGWFPFQRRT